MRIILYLTHIMSSAYISVTIVGLITKQASVWKWGIGLFVVNMLLGIVLQYAVDTESKANRQKSEFMEMIRDFLREEESIQENIEEEEEEEEKEETNQLAGEVSKMTSRQMLKDLYLSLGDVGGCRKVEFFWEDDAADLLISTCLEIPHSPIASTFRFIRQVSSLDIGGHMAVKYTFDLPYKSIASTAFLVLVETKDNDVRLFAIEYGAKAFVLCEYAGHSHKNYGNFENDRDWIGRIDELIN